MLDRSTGEEMAHRKFTDADGVRWQTWEVIPTTAERRDARERRAATRKKDERRTHQQFRVRMDDGLAEGWLVFESAAEKRRLHPIPPGWTERTDDELARLCSLADAAPRPTRRLVE
jgi:hypothetical protein